MRITLKKGEEDEALLIKPDSKIFPLAVMM